MQIDAQGSVAVNTGRMRSKGYTRHETATRECTLLPNLIRLLFWAGRRRS
ncbi:hypothetical protein BH10PSE12_BH10PSE12_08870 [soil metagenome]